VGLSGAAHWLRGGSAGAAGASAIACAAGLPLPLPPPPPRRRRRRREELGGACSGAAAAGSGGGVSAGAGFEERRLRRAGGGVSAGAGSGRFASAVGSAGGAAAFPRRLRRPRAGAPAVAAWRRLMSTVTSPSSTLSSAWSRSSICQTASPQRGFVTSRLRPSRQTAWTVVPGRTGFKKRQLVPTRATRLGWGTSIEPSPMAIEISSEPCATRPPNCPCAARWASMWSGPKSPETPAWAVRSASVMVRPRVGQRPPSSRSSK